MSIPNHHTEWLSLTDTSGPFLSLQVLLEAFPQGLEAHNPNIYRSLKQAYLEWSENNQDPSIHRAWIEWVLTQALEYPEEILLKGQNIPPGLQIKIPEQQETLKPDLVLISPTNNKQIKLLISIVPPDQNLEKPLKNSRWKASPATRMLELLHSNNHRLGLLTNGEQWMLINAPRGETTGYISWYGNLWTEEKLTVRSFCTLLGVRQFFAVAAEDTLESLLEKSKNTQEEVTNQLGEQVRKAVEVLIQKIDKIDQDYHGKLLENIAGENTRRGK